MTQPTDLALGDDFCFLFISDTHIQNASHERLAHLKESLTGVDFVVFGGDITQNGRQADVDYFLELANGLGIPALRIPGNHDVYSGGWDATKAFGPSSWNVSLGNGARIIGLDTANGTLGVKQYEWLSDQLKSAGEETVILVSHVQFFTNRFLETQQFTFPEETALILKLCESTGVDLILSGHAHRFDSKTIGPIRHIVSPAYPSEAGRAGGFLRVTRQAGVVQVTLETL